MPPFPRAVARSSGEPPRAAPSMRRSTAEVQYDPAVVTVGQGQRGVLGPAAVVAAKLLFSALTIAAYGFHRDELYLQQCGQHLAWGFVDHGPLVPALSSLALRAFGASPAA